MAASAFTIRDTYRTEDGLNIYIAEYLPPTSYTTGGDVIDPAANTEIRRVSGVAGGYVLEFVPATQKLKIMYGDNNNAADGPLIEIPSTTDLSATIFYCTAFGK